MSNEKVYPEKGYSLIDQRYIGVAGNTQTTVKEPVSTGFHGDSTIIGYQQLGILLDSLLY